MRFCNWSVEISISRFGLLNSDVKSRLEDIPAHLRFVMFWKSVWEAAIYLPTFLVSIRSVHIATPDQIQYRHSTARVSKRFSLPAAACLRARYCISANLYGLQISARRKTSALRFCRHQST